jgi:hypothetical protein
MTYIFDHFLKCRLLTVFQLHLGLESMECDYSREEFDRPWIYSDEKAAIVKAMPIVRHQHIDIAEFWRGRNENVEGNF